VTPGILGYKYDESVRVRDRESSQMNKEYLDKELNTMMNLSPKS